MDSIVVIGVNHGWSQMKTAHTIFPTGIEEILAELVDFAKNLFNMLREEGYGLQTTQFYFVGGGAVVMSTFGEIDQRNVKYNFDVNANAKGFEKLARIALNRNARK